ncbi:MAG: hypothetical protein IJ093_04705 [Bacilli bacterium]|nr:hypothetical protein [Bacilli bacterium]
MAKFCSNCGKELKDGKKCDCKKGEYTENEMVNSIINLAMDIFSKPIDTIKDFTKQKNFSFAMILMAIMSFIAGIFSLSLVNNAEYAVTGLVSPFTIIPVLSSNLPYMKIFFTTVAVCFGLSFVYAGVLYLVNNSIFKGEANYKEIYALCGVVSIINSCVMIGATVLMFINMTLGVLLILFGCVLSLVYTYHGIKFIGQKDENMHGYIYLLTLAIFMVIVFVLTKIFL